jgi:hypothetical protein
MSVPGIPENVLQFIAEKIDTVPQIEALLLLWENPQHDWSEQELASRIYVSSEDAASILQALQRRQLIALASAAPVTYRYSTEWDPAGELMSEVAGTYRRHLVPLTTYIHSRASSAVREFARAFDLKKDR